jgi:hypothetical protein
VKGLQISNFIKIRPAVLGWNMREDRLRSRYDLRYLHVVQRIISGPDRSNPVGEPRYPLARKGRRGMPLPLSGNKPWYSSHWIDWDIQNKIEWKGTELPNTFAQTIMYLTCIRGITWYKSEQDIIHPKVFNGLTQSLQDNSGLVPWNRPRPVPSPSSPIHHSSIIPSFDAT